MENLNLTEVRKKYKDNQDVISLFSGAMRLDFCPECSPDVKIPVIIQGKDGKPHMLHGMASASTVAWISIRSMLMRCLCIVLKKTSNSTV